MYAGGMYAGEASTCGALVVVALSALDAVCLGASTGSFMVRLSTWGKCDLREEKLEGSVPTRFREDVRAFANERRQTMDKPS